MRKIWGYLKARVEEKTTWLGLALLLAAAAVLVFWRQEIFAWLSAAASALMIGLEDRVLHRGLQALTQPKEKEMGVLGQVADAAGGLSVTTLTTGVSDVLKLVKDGVAVEEILRTKGIEGLSDPSVGAFLADLQKIEQDLTAARAAPAAGAVA